MSSSTIEICLAISSGVVAGLLLLLAQRFVLRDRCEICRLPEVTELMTSFRKVETKWKTIVYLRRFDELDWNITPELVETAEDARLDLETVSGDFWNIARKAREQGELKVWSEDQLGNWKRDFLTVMQDRNAYEYDRTKREELLASGPMFMLQFWEQTTLLAKFAQTSSPTWEALQQWLGRLVFFALGGVCLFVVLKALGLLAGVG